MFFWRYLIVWKCSLQEQMLSAQSVESDEADIWTKSLKLALCYQPKNKTRFRIQFIILDKNSCQPKKAGVRIRIQCIIHHSSLIVVVVFTIVGIVNAPDIGIPISQRSRAISGEGGLRWCIYPVWENCRKMSRWADDKINSNPQINDKTKTQRLQNKTTEITQKYKETRPSKMGI